MKFVSLITVSLFVLASAVNAHVLNGTWKTSASDEGVEITQYFIVQLTDADEAEGTVTPWVETADGEKVEFSADPVQVRKINNRNFDLTNLTVEETVRVTLSGRDTITFHPKDTDNGFSIEFTRVK